MIDAIFAVSPTIRYVAVGRGQAVELRERAGLADASSSESDRFAYGNFFQLVLPHDGGHVSVAIERSQSPTDLVEPIRAAVSGRRGGSSSA